MRKWLRLLDLNSYFTAAGVAAGAAAVSAGAAVYGGVQQKNAAEEQADIQAQAMQDAQDQEQALFAQRAIDAENKGNATVEFGIDDEDDEIGTYDDFLTPTAVASNTGLGGAKNTGLMI